MISFSKNNRSLSYLKITSFAVSCHPWHTRKRVWFWHAWREYNNQFLDAPHTAGQASHCRQHTLTSTPMVPQPHISNNQHNINGFGRHIIESSQNTWSNHRRTIASLRLQQTRLSVVYTVSHIHIQWWRRRRLHSTPLLGVSLIDANDGSLWSTPTTVNLICSLLWSKPTPTTVNWTPHWSTSTVESHVPSYAATTSTSNGDADADYTVDDRCNLLWNRPWSEPTSSSFEVTSSVKADTPVRWISLRSTLLPTRRGCDRRSSFGR